MKIQRLTLSGILIACFFLGGCSTVSSAYTSTVDTVSGWFGSDSKK